MALGGTSSIQKPPVVRRRPSERQPRDSRTRTTTTTSEGAKARRSDDHAPVLATRRCGEVAVGGQDLQHRIEHFVKHPSRNRKESASTDRGDRDDVHDERVLDARRGGERHDDVAVCDIGARDIGERTSRKTTASTRACRCSFKRARFTRDTFSGRATAAEATRRAQREQAGELWTRTSARARKSESLDMDMDEGHRLGGRREGRDRRPRGGDRARAQASRSRAKACSTKNPHTSSGPTPGLQPCAPLRARGCFSPPPSAPIEK